MKCFVVAAMGLLWFGCASADRLYSDSFEIPVVHPLFPHVCNTIPLPPGPTTDQLTWIMGELATGQTTIAKSRRSSRRAGF